MAGRRSRIRAMQFETALRSPALAMQLSNVVKTLVLLRHERAEAHREHDGDNQRQDAAHDPGDGLPVARRASCPTAANGNAAEDSREQASRQGEGEQDEGRRRPPGWPRREPGRPRPAPFPGRADRWRDSTAVLIREAGCPWSFSPVAAALTPDGREHITATTLAKR